jgi:hypothetical protein
MLGIRRILNYAVERHKFVAVPISTTPRAAADLNLSPGL